MKRELLLTIKTPQNTFLGHVIRGQLKISASVEESQAREQEVKGKYLATTLIRLPDPSVIQQETETSTYKNWISKVLFQDVGGQSPKPLKTGAHHQ